MGVSPSHCDVYTELPSDNPMSGTTSTHATMSIDIERDMEVRRILKKLDDDHGVKVTPWYPDTSQIIREELKGNKTSEQYRAASHAFAEISRVYASSCMADNTPVLAYIEFMQICRTAYNKKRTKELLLPPYTMKCSNEELYKEYINSYKAREYMRTLWKVERDKVAKFIKNFNQKTQPTLDDIEEQSAIFEIIRDDYFDILTKYIQAAESFNKNANLVFKLSTHETHEHVYLGVNRCKILHEQYVQSLRLFDEFLSEIKKLKRICTICTTSV